MISLNFERQNNFYKKHKNSEDYKYMKKYSSNKSKAKAFVTKFASEPDLLDLRDLINERLDDLKVLDEKMEGTLHQAHENGIELAKNLGIVRRGFAAKLKNDLYPVAFGRDAKLKQEAINRWSGDYLTACVQADVSAFDKFLLTTDMEKKLRIAYSITAALTGNPT